MSEMIERVARALAAHFGPEFDHLPADRAERRKLERQGADFNGNDKEAMLCAARDAIEAMRDPAKAMLKAPGKLLSSDEYVSVGLAALAWPAMIDEALK